jgi:hypothetical protein
VRRTFLETLCIACKSTLEISEISLDETEVPKGKVRMPFKYNETVASMCSHLWEYKRDELVGDKDLFAAFKEIVIYLVARQNATGLELQERLLSMK